MKKWFQAQFEKLLGWFLGWLWKKEKPKLVAAMESNAVLNIPGLAIPIPLTTIGAFSPAIDVIIEDLKGGHDAQTILANVKKNVVPEAIAAAEVVLGLFFPLGGALLAFIVWLVEHRDMLPANTPPPLIPGYDGQGNLVMIPNPDVRK